MIELERHIEILLLSNDCVIIPDLGGFMAHHIDACYDDEGQMFLPPKRMLGFNPQLKINDSLLVQSYIEAYDISYPEALRRIESEVSELRRHLQEEGSYELNDIGVLYINDNGKMEFSPCEAGILTPELYGLSTFEMPQLKTAIPVIKAETEPEGIQKEEERPAVIIEMRENPVPADEEPEETPDEEEEEEEKTISIKVSWIRNTVAAAAAIIAFFLISTPVSNSVSQLEQTAQNASFIHLQTKDADIKKPIPSKQTMAPAKKDTIAMAAQDTVAATLPPTLTADTYCIVLASQVAKKNAKNYVNMLHKDGYQEAEIYIRNEMVRVVYGNYETEGQAYQALRQLRTNKAFEEAWVYKKKATL